MSDQTSDIDLEGLDWRGVATELLRANADLQARLDAAPPTEAGPAREAEGLTIEQVRQMGTDELNERFTEVQEFLTEHAKREQYAHDQRVADAVAAMADERDDGSLGSAAAAGTRFTRPAAAAVHAPLVAGAIRTG